MLRPEASFELALRLRKRGGATLGEVMSFLSGLYFRGKLTYARRFEPEGVFVITPNRGLVSVDSVVSVKQLLASAEVDIHVDEPRYTRPLLRDARALRERLGETGSVVLLGSIATPKYVEPLGDVFGQRLLFPPSFVGRGDMSRGGLLLRAAREGVELEYGPVHGAVRNGKRPPRLPRGG